jgi:hypothetical protein
MGLGLQLLGILGATQAHFGGEDLLAPAGEPAGSGREWHHEHLTRDAAVEAGWALSAATELAWHADYVDTYLYNPLWWTRGGMDRLKAAMAMREALASLHFDDLFSTPQVVAAWQRYLGGTVVGLLWARERGDVHAARNVVGASLHALQDFYSHSNWVDDRQRRGRTWFDLTPAERLRSPFYTGSYEVAGHHGVKPHGKYAPECLVLNHSGTKAMLDIACHAMSPATKSGLCDAYRNCQTSTSVGMKTVRGVPIPKGILYLGPPGIAIDSKWLAPIAREQRGLTDISAQELFATAYRLAERTSLQWLRRLDALMQQADAGSFWSEVKQRAGADARTRETQFERFDRVPFTFLSAGAYPPDGADAGDGWFLRVTLGTARDHGAGTNADIRLTAGGRSFLLDLMPYDNPLLAYNDFEAGDNDAYVVGPFPSLPTSLTLRNDDATTGDVLAAFGRSFTTAVTSALTSLGDFALSLIGGHADHVGTRKHVWTAAELATITAQGRSFVIDVDGRAEGHYRVHGLIRRTNESIGGAVGDWREFRVELQRLQCVKESKWDRGSSSDEPFVLALLNPLGGGTVQRLIAGPYSDVDSGEWRDIGRSFAPVRVARDYGMLALPLQVWESDDESSSARQQLLNEFASLVEKGTATPRKGFLDTLGAAIAADWKLHRIEVYAFTRGTTVRAGTALDQTVNAWIHGGTSRTFQLQGTKVRTLPNLLAEPGSGPVEAATGVVSSGSTQLRGTYTFDLESGVQGGSGPAADLWWQQVDGTTRSLEARNGARLANLGKPSFDSVTATILRAQPYTLTSIDGSNTAANRLTPGTVVAVRTAAGNDAKVLVQTYGYDLGIRWVTYEGGAASTPLAVPGLLTPAEGQVFPERVPRTTTLTWAAVPGATSYRVEVCYGQLGPDPQWSAPAISTVTGTSYTFDFVGCQPGRWRVTALAGTSSSTASPWRHFRYAAGAVTAPSANGAACHYLVRAGDTFGSIAGRVLGSAARAAELEARNSGISLRAGGRIAVPWPAGEYVYEVPAGGSFWAATRAAYGQADNALVADVVTWNGGDAHRPLTVGEKLHCPKR